MVRPSCRGKWIALLLVLGATSGSASTAVEPPASDQAARPNLVLITLDTTRADFLGAWGAKKAGTPHLDRLASRGIRFTRCDTSSPLTLPSHAGMLTGLYPPGHGVRANSGFVLSEATTTVTESLKHAGYQTVAVVSASVLARGYGLARGFDVYDDDFLNAGFRGTTVVERTAAPTTDAALGYLAKLEAPFFLWVHYFDPHAPYGPAKGPRKSTQVEAEEIRAYAGEIAVMDREIGRLLESLPAETAVLVVGDHGEMLGEHGEHRHGLLPFAGARRVPLIIAGPGLPRGGEVDSLVRTIDVAPTLLQLASVEVPPSLGAESLLPLIDAQTPAPRLSYWESFYPFLTFGWYPLRAVSDGRYLYVHGPHPTLYDIREGKSAGEKPLSASGDRLDTWRRRLNDLLTGLGESLNPAVAGERSIDRRQQESLASLGYIGGLAGGEVTDDLPDPRLLTAEAEFLQQAAGQVEASGCGQILSKARSIVDRQPKNPAARLLVGRCLLQGGEPRSALKHFLAAGESPLALGYLADALLRLGRDGQAAEALRRSLNRDPANSRAAAALARVLRRRGELGEARQVATSAIEAGAGAAEVYFERALAFYAEQQKEEALGDLEQAVKRAPEHPAALANAARLARELDRLPRAAELYEAWLRRRPNQPKAWQELAELYLRLQEPMEALRCYRRALTLESHPERRRRLENKIRHLGNG